MTKILFVCLGNICRSPMAHGVLRHRVAERGATGQITIDSAGTGDWHLGSPPDARAIAAAAARGIDIADLRARCVRAADFRDFDLIIAMDHKNVADMAPFMPSEAKEEARAKIKLLMDYAPALGATEVPDPFHGGAADFPPVLEMIEAACAPMLDDLLGPRGSYL